MCWSLFAEVADLDLANFAEERSRTRGRSVGEEKEEEEKEKKKKKKKKKKKNMEWVGIAHVASSHWGIFIFFKILFLTLNFLKILK